MKQSRTELPRRAARVDTIVPANISIKLYCLSIYGSKITLNYSIIDYI